MKAFLLAAGYGERLAPITGRMPKPLVPVLNIPSICYSIMLLKEAGVEFIVCNLHYRYRQIVDFFQDHDNFGLRVAFSYEKKILGTGGGLMNCHEHFADGPFIYLNSDIISDIDLASLVRALDSQQDGGILAVSAAPGRPCPVAALNGRIVNLRNILPAAVEPGHDFLGAAVFSPEIFNHLKSGHSDIVDTGLMDLVRRGRLGYLDHNGPWYDIGTPETYRRANIGLIEEGNPFAARIEKATGLVSLSVSRDALVGAGAEIIRSVVGAGCVIGEGAVVEESVLLPGARIKRGARVVRAVMR